MKRILMSLGLLIAAMLGGVLLPMSSDCAAADICSDPSMPEDMKAAAGCNDFGVNKKTAVPIALNIINVVLSFVGIIAVGVIVYGGIIYTTSTGDSSKIHKAKNTILYGLVGLVVAIMAFAIVAFVNSSVLSK